MPFGIASGAGVIFGVTGGVTEAVIRRLVPGHGNAVMDSIAEAGMRGEEGIKEFSITYEGKELNICVASGLANARKVMEQVQSKEKEYHLIEIMACRRGCIMGGGQLGLMIVEQAHLLGARTLCLDPAPDAPAFALSDGHIVAAYDDAAALEELCRRSDVVTYEFENVPGSVLIPLEKKYNIPQGFRPLCDSQDRLREKDNARANGLRTPLYAAVDDEASLRAALAEIGFPAVLKTRTLGYDGHGQLVLKDEADVPRALPMLSVPCILEAFVPFDFEASIVMVSDGERVIHFPIGRNVHRDGILDLCFVPAEGMDDGLRSRMAAAGERFMKSCRYRGILAIEFFIRDGEFYFNEMAPRPHNSGHYTIEGCTTNQFRELVRFLLGEPLQEPRLVAPTVMKNILGQDLEAAERVAAENRPGVHVHLYGKTESRPKRKMGHITFVGMDAGEYGAAWADRFVK